jgi:hypothetical protein
MVQVTKDAIVLKKWVIPSSFLGWWGGGPYKFTASERCALPLF